MSDADVVNLHWIGSGMLSIEDIGRLPLPLVWTLHDMWAFCGAEHYAPDDASARWRTGYMADNRDPGDGGFDLDRITWKRKRRSWPQSHVVAPSAWLAQCASESVLMKGWPIHVIPNPIDVSVFAPSSREDVRRAMGIPTGTRVVAFGALSAADPRKGFDLLTKAFGLIPGLIENPLGLVFGAGEPDPSSDSSMPVRWLGPVTDDLEMARIYSAADVVVVPSRQENLPQAATEALSCGTPVVAFDTSGLGHAVRHMETGYLADPFSAEDLAAGVGWVLGSEERTRGLGRAARQRAVTEWAPEVIATQYRKVFLEAISDHERQRAG